MLNWKHNYMEITEVVQYLQSDCHIMKEAGTENYSAKSTLIVRLELQ